MTQRRVFAERRCYGEIAFRIEPIVSTTSEKSSSIEKGKIMTKLTSSAVALTALAFMALSASVPALAASPSATELSANSWRVFNIDTSVPKLWDINKAEALSTGGVGFPFQTSTTEPAVAWDGTGWFTVYLKTNYNRDLTDKTITAIVDVVADASTQFWTRSTLSASGSGCTSQPAYVRLEFQSATGNYNASDYWWSTGNTWNLSTIANVQTTLILSTTNAGAWSNINGQTGLGDPAGFAAALKNVKEIGVAFGSSCSYASGVNVSGGPASFQLQSYTVTTPTP